MVLHSITSVWTAFSSMLVTTFGESIPVFVSDGWFVFNNIIHCIRKSRYASTVCDGGGWILAHNSLSHVSVAIFCQNLNISHSVNIIAYFHYFVVEFSFWEGILLLLEITTYVGPSLWARVAFRNDSGARGNSTVTSYWRRRDARKSRIVAFAIWTPGQPWDPPLVGKSHWKSIPEWSHRELHHSAFSPFIIESIRIPD